MDLNPVPVMSILATLVCLIGVCLFFSQFYRGIGLCTSLLQAIFLIPDEYVEYLDNYRIIFSVLATLTFALGFVVVLTDYLHTDARYARNPLCQFCEGPLPSIVLMVVVFMTAIVWLWVYFKVDQIHFMYFIFSKECDLQATKNLWANNSKACKTFGYFDAWFPDNTTLNVCGEKLREFCVDFIKKTTGFFQLSSISCVMIIVGLGFLLMSLAAMLTHGSDRDQDEVGEIEGSQTSVHSYRGR